MLGLEYIAFGERARRIVWLEREPSWSGCSVSLLNSETRGSSLQLLTEVILMAFFILCEPRVTLSVESGFRLTAGDFYLVVEGVAAWHLQAAGSATQNSPAAGQKAKAVISAGTCVVWWSSGGRKSHRSRQSADVHEQANIPTAKSPMPGKRSPIQNRWWGHCLRCGR